MIIAIIIKLVTFMDLDVSNFVMIHKTSLGHNVA